MAEIKFGPAEVYVNGVDMAGRSIDVYTEESDDFLEEVKIIESVLDAYMPMLDVWGELSVSTRVAADAFVRLYHALTDMTDTIKNECHNKRVVHLAFHAKKKRTRKKNYRRMLKIVEDQL